MIMTQDYNKDDPESIKALFNHIATRYDRTNDIISCGLNRYWNKQLIKKVIGQNKADTLLDLCCGTGDISFAYLKSSQHQCQAYLLDFSQEMLACASKKASQMNLHSLHKISFIQGDAQQISLPDQSINYATVAYGIRNVKDSNQCIQEVFRVLRPGGWFGILELTRPTWPLFRSAYHFYLKNLLPPIGRLITSDPKAYQYLCKSINEFIEPKKVEQILINSGFSKTSITPLTGGVATIITGQKSF